jgi:hypothetical protein
VGNLYLDDIPSPISRLTGTDEESLRLSADERTGIAASTSAAARRVFTRI